MTFHHSSNRYFEFGINAIMKLPEIIQTVKEYFDIYSENVILVTGAASFAKTETYRKLIKVLSESECKNILDIHSLEEPSPKLISSSLEEAVNRFGIEACRERNIIVVSIGGGSVLDTGKALSAMLPLVSEKNPLPNVKDYLEGVGTKNAEGVTVPFIACPTTAGTGSEATKNAVLSEAGPGGFKKSLRHENYLPVAAVIDPALAVTCPRSVTAASGLDALTQLIEAWTSPLLTPMISSLIEGALKNFTESFLKALDKGNDLAARENLAYAAYISGLALSNCGLGSVHGMASVIGGLFPIPHGVICGNLIKAGAECNIKKMIDSKQEFFSGPLNAYARAGFILSGKSIPDHSGVLSESHLTQGTDLLLETLGRLLEAAALPAFQSFGFDEKSIPDIAALSKAKSNPVTTTKEDYEWILRSIL